MVVAIGALVLNFTNKMNDNKLFVTCFIIVAIAACFIVKTCGEQFIEMHKVNINVEQTK